MSEDSLDPKLGAAERVVAAIERQTQSITDLQTDLHIAQSQLLAAIERITAALDDQTRAMLATRHRVDELDALVAQRSAGRETRWELYVASTLDNVLRQGLRNR